MPPLTLLLLSGGGHTGLNVVASLASRRNSVRLVTTSDIPDEPSLFAFDAAYLAPRLAADSAGFERRLLEILDREAPDLVIPCRDEDVEWLAGFAERHGQWAGKLLCGNRETAEIVNDKWLSHEFCMRHGLPFVASLPTGLERDPATFVQNAGLPLIAKPRRGSDSKGILLLTTQVQVDRAMSRAGCVLQSYLGDPAEVTDYLQQVNDLGVPIFHSFLGRKRSIQVMIGPNGEIENIFCTLNEMTGRISRSVSVDPNPESRRIGERCAAAFAQAGLRGPLNIQCQPTESGRLLIHEFNARFTGATASRWHLGVDEVGTAVRLFTGRGLEAGRPLDDPPLAVFESLTPRAANPREVGALAMHGEWRHSTN